MLIFCESFFYKSPGPQKGDVRTGISFLRFIENNFLLVFLMNAVAQ